MNNPPTQQAIQSATIALVLWTQASRIYIALSVHNDTSQALLEHSIR
jgi:hypothetical protein